jgi:hypothetical protein
MLFDDTDRIISGDVLSESTEQFIDVDKIKQEHPQLYDYVTSLIPATFEDIPCFAALVTETSVDIVDAKVANGVALSLGGKIAKVTCFTAATAPIEIAIDLALASEDGYLTKGEVAKAITLAMIDVASTTFISYGLAAIGITGASGVLLGVALAAGVGVAADRAWDIWVDPDTILARDKNTNTVSITTVLTFADYFDYHWDKLNEWDNWTLASDESELVFKFRREDNEFLFSEPKID